MGSLTMNAAIAMEGIPSIDEVLAVNTTPTTAAAEETTTTSTDAISTSSTSTTTTTTTTTTKPAAYETVETIPVPTLPPNSAHTRYYSTSNISTASLAVPTSEPAQQRRRSRSRSLFSFRSSSSSSPSGSPRSSLESGDDAAVAAARRGGKGAAAAGGRRSRSRTNSVHAAAVLPAVLVLGAECFTPGHGGSESK
ncbi:hypothetical protein UCRNP2_10104 [Neofusicoccum parvum UCRNP2]|uniref:Uncharacterized protein n=1 Tax=Botryosphaeria parva (strain UCR-NP2) TaxID=1287680 RepID=R1FVS0_BOTPV|nr:hypothetical protein UCRNP2_10104 [Neofusicoccum parvum UCRNP2]